MKRIFRHNFFIRLRSWEYWPFWVVQFPLAIYWLWLSIKARSMFFFSAANPGIALGGMFGESKYTILQRMPPAVTPKTILIKMPATTEAVIGQVTSSGFSFPLVFKPDIGERGFLVKRIFTRDDVDRYLQNLTVNFIAQELVDLPLECGVFYTRFPGEAEGKVTSLTIKEMLSVTGDGHATVQKLILQSDRAKLQWSKLKEMHQDQLHKILQEGEVLELNPIGNHCLGTTFLNGNRYITPALSASFDRISKQLGNFYFGRFDLKCSSLDDLEKGNVKILEVNGCGAEPSHIYQPGYSLRVAYRDLFTHWENLFRISIQNKSRGYAYTPFREGVTIYRHFRARMKTP
jgi:hypothetical protein